MRLLVLHQLHQLLLDLRVIRVNLRNYLTQLQVNRYEVNHVSYALQLPHLRCRHLVFRVHCSLLLEPLLSELHYPRREARLRHKVRPLLAQDRAEFPRAAQETHPNLLLRIQRFSQVIQKYLELLLPQPQHILILHHVALHHLDEILLRRQHLLKDLRVLPVHVLREQLEV